MTNSWFSRLVDTFSVGVEPLYLLCPLHHPQDELRDLPTPSPDDAGSARQAATGKPTEH